MFGYIKPYIPELSAEEKERYRSVYCGICRSLGERYGQTSRLAVNYDMTFLALLLSSLYEPDEKYRQARCLPHPVKQHDEAMSEVIDYAADMTIALTYYKCLDDWQDERKLPQKMCADRMKKDYEAVKTRWPVQCAAIEDGIFRLSAVEKMRTSRPEAAVHCGGVILSRLLVWKEDFWERQLEWLGTSLGGFIYLMDAAMDYEKDQKRGSYNPLVQAKIPPDRARELIMQPLGEASEAFESLPLVRDVHLMRNIIYSGVWQEYNQKMTKDAKGAAHGQ